MVTTRAMSTWIPTGLLLIAVLGACSEITVEGEDVSMQLTADKTAVATGEAVRIEYAATGRYLSGIVIDFGDGTSDSVYTYGAQKSDGHVSHEWALPGDYIVLGVAVDATQGSATSDIQIKVSAPATN